MRNRVQMPLEPLLVEPRVVEGAELRRQAAQRPDQLKLPCDPVDGETEPRLAREVEPGLGLVLHVTERITGGKEIRDQVVPAARCIHQIAKSVGRVEGAPDQAAAGSDGLRPRNDAIPKAHVDAGLEATQPALLYQVQAELAEAEPGPVVAEVRPEDHGEPHIGETRSVAVAVLEAEVDHVADDERAQILVSVPSRRHESGEDVHRPARDRIDHPGQVEQRLDRTIADPLPHPLIFVPNLLLRRTCRPGDADAAQVLEADLDTAVGLVQALEKLHLQPRDGGAIGEAGGTAGEVGKALLRCRRVASDEFALGTVQLECED